MKRILWVELTVIDDSKYISGAPARKKMQLQPSHILSICEHQDDLTGAKAEVVLREPDDGYSGNELEVLHGLRTLLVTESLGEIRSKINAAEQLYG